MNVYAELNKIIEYTENHLEEEIDYKKIASMIGINEYTFQKVFLLIANVSYAEYIRNRRLSNAGQEIFLNKEKVINIAIKYQYNNATSFSRAFEKFHGIKPSEARENPKKLKMYTKLHFNEQYEPNYDINYEIVEKDEIVLYGHNIPTDNEKIKEDAPKFYLNNAKKYGAPDYGVIEYTKRDRMYVKSYGIMYKQNKGRMPRKVIPKSKWIQIKINSQEAEDIQKVSESFYTDFMPSSKYVFSDLPELEYYHDNITDFLIPIED